MTGTTMQEKATVRDEREAAFAAKVVAIAEALATLESKAGWTAEVPTDVHDRKRRGALVNGKGERMYLAFDAYANKIAVHGTWPSLPSGSYWTPRNHKHDAPSETINVGGDRPPVAIAKDIARRFLPTYREYLGWAIEDSTRMTNHAAKTRETFDALVEASGGAVKPRNTNKTDAYVETLTASLYDVGGISYGSVSVSGDHVRLELSTSPAFAVKVAKLIGRK